MGTQIADLYAKIGADTGEFDKGLGHVQKSMEDTQQKAGGLGSALSGVFSMAGGFLLAQGIGAVTGAVGGLVSGMISGNAEFERYETQFGVLLGSTQAAKDRLAELADFGAKTPFELPEVVRADKILQAFGLHAENTAERFGMSGKEIRTVAGDVAAGTGASFEEISTYLGKFASGATGEAIARMQELGIVTRDQLKQMGLEFSGSGQLISPLDESMGVLLTAMKSKFGGMMDAQSATFEGMMSNLQDWVGQAMRTMGAPIFDALKENLSSLLQFLGSDTVKGAITGIGQGLAQGVSVAVNAVQGLISVVGDLKNAFDTLTVGGEVGDVLGDIAAKLNLPTEIVGLWQSVGGAMVDMRNTAQILAPALAAIFEGAEPAEAMMEAVVGLSDSFGPVAAVMSVAQASTSEFGKALLYAANIAGIAAGTFETIKSIVGDTLANAFAAFKSSAQVALTWLPGILDTAMARGQELASIVSSLLVSAFANFGRIANAVFAILPGLVGDVMNVLSSLYDTVGTVLVGAFRILQPIAITVFQVVATAVENLAPKVATLAAAVSDTLSTAFAVLRQVAVAVFTAIEPYIPAIQAAIAKLGEVVTTVLGAAFEWLSGFMRDTLVPMLKQLGDWLAANLPGAIDALAGFISGTLIPALQNVWAFIQANVIPILLQLRDWLATNLPSAIATLTDFWNTKLKPALEAVWAFIKDPLLPLLKTLAEIVGVALMKAVEVLLAVWEKLQPAFKVVADFLAGTLNRLLSGLVTTFENLRGPIGWVNDRLNEFKQALSGLSLPEWLQRHSPSPIEQTFMGLADVTPQATDTLRTFGAAAGSLDAASLNVQAVQDLAAAMRMLTQIMGAPGMGVEPGSNDEERINTMSDAIGKIVTAIKGVVDTIALVSSETGAAAVARIREGRAQLDAIFDAILDFGRGVAQRAGAVRVTYSEQVIAALQSLGDMLQRASAAYTATIGIVKAFLDDVNNPAFLGALGSVAARNWIADLVQLIVQWGNQIVDAVDEARLTFDARATPGLVKLGDLLQAVSGVYSTTIGIVTTFLDDVNNRRFLGALGSVAARAWIVDLTVLIVQWGNQIAAAAAQVQVTANTQATPGLEKLGALLSAVRGVYDSTIGIVKTFLEDVNKPAFLGALGSSAARRWIATLVSYLVEWGNMIASAADDVAVTVNTQATPGLENLGEALSALSGVVTQVVAIAKSYLDNTRLFGSVLTSEGLATPEFTQFVQDAINTAGNLIVDIQAAVLVIDGALVDRLKTLGDAVSGLAGVMGGVLTIVQGYIDGNRTLSSALTSEGLATPAFTQFVQAIVTTAGNLIVDIQAAVLTINESVTPALKALGDAISALSGVMGGVIDVITLYFDTLYGGDKWATWIDESLYSETIQRFIQAWAQRLINFGEALRAAALAAVDVVDADTLSAYQQAADNLGNLGDVLGRLNDVMGSVIGIIRLYFDTLYGDDKWARWMEEALYSPTIQLFIKAWLKRLIDFGEELRIAANEAVGTINRDGIESLSNLGDSLSALSSVTGSVLDIFRAYMATVEDKIRFTDADVQANVKGMVGVLVAFGLALRQAALDVLTARDITELEAIPALEQLGKAVGDLSGMLGSVFDILRLFMPGDDAVDYGAEAQQRVNDALLGLIGFAVWLADRTSSTLAFYQAETLVINKGLEIVRDAVGTTADMLGSVFDILRLFAVGDDATDYSEAAQQRVEDALIELVSFAAWLANRVNATLDYYQAETIVINKGLETVSKTLSETVSIVTDTLSLSKLSKDMAAYKPMVGHAAIETALGRIIEDAKYVAKLFADKAKDSGLTTELQKAAETLSAVFGDASSAINDTLDMVAKLLDPETVIPSKEQVSGKIAAILDVVDVAVAAFSARASAAAASGMDLAGLSTYASAVKGVFEAIAEVANAVNSYSNINVGRQFLGVESVGFGNIRGALQMIWDLFEDAAQHQDLVQSVTSTLTTALDGLTMLATNKGADAGNAWLAGFTSAFGGGIAVPALAPAGTGAGAGGQVTINNVVNNNKSVSVSVTASTAEASRAGVTGIYSLVMY